MAELLVASRNAKKLAELHRILDPLLPGLRIVGIEEAGGYDEPVEDRPDFAGNALVKARAGLAATGLPTVADDSGLCVDALNGMPGVLSARWAGRPRSDDRNNQLLLDQLADVPDSRRGARFCCAVALCAPGGVEEVRHGEVPGRVIGELRGTGGFGYDALFCPDGYDRTTAELDPHTKDAISHRGRALAAIAPVIVAALGGR